MYIRLKTLFEFHGISELIQLLNICQIHEKALNNTDGEVVVIDGGWTCFFRFFGTTCSSFDCLRRGILKRNVIKTLSVKLNKNETTFECDFHLWFISTCCTLDLLSSEKVKFWTTLYIQIKKIKQFA